MLLVTSTRVRVAKPSLTRLRDSASAVAHGHVSHIERGEERYRKTSEEDTMGWRFCQQIIRHEITGDGGTCGVPTQQTLVQQSLCRVRGRSAHEHARGR